MVRLLILWVGFMYAPAQGEETRKKLSTVFEEHEGTLDGFLSRGREALGDAIDAISRSENHKDEN